MPVLVGVNVLVSVCLLAGELGCAFCMIGAILIVLFAPRQLEVTSLQLLGQQLLQPGTSFAHIAHRATSDLSQLSLLSLSIYYILTLSCSPRSYTLITIPTPFFPIGIASHSATRRSKVLNSVILFHKICTFARKPH